MEERDSYARAEMLAEADALEYGDDGYDDLSVDAFNRPYGSRAHIVHSVDAAGNRVWTLQDEETTHVVSAWLVDELGVRLPGAPR